VRLLLVAGAELSGPEAYWALCGQQPEVAYFDGPGGTALAVAAGLSWGNTAGLLWPIFALLATLGLYRLAAPLTGRPAAVAAAVLLNLLPVFNLNAVNPGSAMPLAMFAFGFLAMAWRGLSQDSTAWWTGAGLCAAGGMFFSYQAWFFLPAIVVVMLASRRWRPRLRTAGFWLAAMSPLVAAGLLLAWNANHDWIHFIRGTWQTALDLQWSLWPAGLKQASMLASPLVLVAVVAALAFALRKIAVAPKLKFLAVPALLALLVAAYAILRGAPAQPAGLIAAGVALPLITWLPASIGRLPSRLLLSIMFATAAAWTGLHFALARPSGSDINMTVVHEIENLRAGQTSPLFLIAEDAPLASAIALHLSNATPALPGHPAVYVLESANPESQFAFWPRYDQFTEAPPAPPEPGTDPFTEQAGVNAFLGRSALYLTMETDEELPQAVSAAFASCRLLAEISLPTTRRLRVFLCSDYQTLPL